ncbi:MAG: thiamine pyrophosphate-binding protein, partial [Phycisphaerales bacterium]
MTSLMGSGRIVGDDLTEALYQAGVRIAFGLDDPRGYWVGLRRSKIRSVVVHDERSGGFMAEAFTRAGGGLATCSGISGPGAANLVPGLLEAYLSSVPVLAVLGEKRPAPFGGREFQGVDHRTLLAGVVKATVEVHSPDDIRAGATQAVRLATSGRPRPVLLLTRDLRREGITQLAQRARRVTAQRDVRERPQLIGIDVDADHRACGRRPFTVDAGEVV